MVEIWIQSAIEEFGKSLGLANLSLQGSGSVQLFFEKLGLLTIQPAEEHVRVCLVRQQPFLTAQQLETALTLCHWEQNPQFAIQVGLIDEDQLMFVSLIPNQQLRGGTLQETLSRLDAMHQTVSSAT